MRADRLISIILLLQTRQRMTAQELSTELEVSVRTIYRDILALSNAGIPIYTDRGPGGGIALLESYRTTLTGMSEAETQALFMLNIPHALTQLGVDQNLKSALLKLAGALPPEKQMEPSRRQQRIYLDSTSWDEPVNPSAHLGKIHQAVREAKLIRLVYQGSFDTRLEFELEALGLVAKADSWYLVGKYQGHPRVFNLARIIDVDALKGNFLRDERFDLAAFWQDWCKASRDRRPVYNVTLRIAPTLLTKLHFYLGEAIKYAVREDLQSDKNNWRFITIRYENFFQARESVLSFGNAAEVVDPGALRLSVIDFARQIVDYYQHSQPAIGK